MSNVSSEIINSIQQSKIIVVLVIEDDSKASDLIDCLYDSGIKNL